MNKDKENRPFWEQLYDELQQQIGDVQDEQRESSIVYKTNIQSCRTSLEKLKAFITTTYSFPNDSDEIRFFKVIKPRFHSLFIYYSKIYSIELRKPVGDRMLKKHYIKKEFYRLKLFFERYYDLYKYYRSGDSSLDEKYFLRKNALSNNFIQPIDADPQFTTGVDYLFSKIIAHERVCDYLSGLLQELSFDETKGIAKTPEKQKLTWTASKVNIGELIYALHASGVFNNTQADVKRIKEYFSEVFNVKISNIYKIFEEIRIRQRNRTAFLDFLRQNLIQRMEKDDEQAL